MLQSLCLICAATHIGDSPALSINDHQDIRRIFDGLNTLEIGIKYSVGNHHGDVATSTELVITNWATAEIGGLF